jgi:hypothetical protein
MERHDNIHTKMATQETIFCIPVVLHLLNHIHWEVFTAPFPEFMFFSLLNLKSKTNSISRLKPKKWFQKGTSKLTGLLP